MYKTPVVKTIECSHITDFDVYLFREGKHCRLYEKFGAHMTEFDGNAGTYFAVWAPNAHEVYVTGDFNLWGNDNKLFRRDDGSGIWEGFIQGVGKGALYKYRVISRDGRIFEKADPFAFRSETPPATASIVWDLDYQWRDEVWLEERGYHNSLNSPISVYECHAGSWKRKKDGSWLSYRELADELPRYLEEMGFTHLELLPITEHPFYGSWGYQTTGYFCPTSRYGTPQDFMYLVDKLHGKGKGLYLDWVPSHFPTDAHGLGYFDGTHLYEYEDWRKRWHPDWRSYVFDYGKGEVRSFLLSSAIFWLDKYHADGLRVDAVASMLYLDYSRREGEWVPNMYGGRENLEAISFLRELNEAVYGHYPDAQMIAEESTAWPMVSRPTYSGGLGFGMKWNMGWMHDTLDYFSKDPVFRKYHHNNITFSIWYAFSENFILPLSHDEVVYGKRSLLFKMPGDEWQKFANLRLLYGYMFSHPGKKLLFMGGEFGQRNEWYHEKGLDWDLKDYPLHAGLSRWIADLNRAYRRERALHDMDYEADGFEWVDFRDYEQSVISYLRRSRSSEVLLAVCNFTPVPREGYRIGVPLGGRWRELLNSDAALYGGSGCGNLGSVEAEGIPFHGRKFSLSLFLPPLGFLLLKPEIHEGLGKQVEKACLDDRRGNGMRRGEVIGGSGVGRAG
ncbi:MAG: 1,4-alpha-glucan branching protein GlgB [Candidatus Verstraetearchaeota archaeon]|nr:1,4-alpha-glucan branching protein GlgB [Candidatus Verstraetearchaeota archaeon]